MWLRKTDGAYINVDTGAEMYVLGSTVEGKATFRIYANRAGAAVSDGYPTAESAQKALDDFMGEEGFKTIPSYVPEAEETDEKETDEKEETF